MADRASIFTEDDLSDFTPAKPPVAPPPEAIKEIAEKASFKSREPERKPEKEQRRERRIYRTGRDAQFSCKAHPDVIARFYAISNEKDWVMGETLDRAVTALERELKG